MNSVVFRILIVEDEIVIAKQLESILTKKGYEVSDIVSTGDEAIARTQALRPDLILMDIKLIGDRDGIEAAREIYKNQAVPIIFLTAHADDDTIRRAACTGSYGYLLKPFNENSIHASIEMAMNKYRLEREINQRNEELLNLTAHIQTIQEEERKKIAREIHDYLGQSLTALKIDCSWLQNGLNGGRIKKNVLNGKIASMIQLIGETLENVKNICTELRPSILDHLGLDIAINWQCNELQKRTGIRFIYEGFSDERLLDELLTINLLRIFQEIATNVVRHADATDVNVTLRRDEQNLFLNVIDNGKGITEENIKNPRSFGLIGMRERVRYLGGSLKITGTHGSGTEVTLSLPLIISRE